MSQLSPAGRLSMELGIGAWQTQKRELGVKLLPKSKGSLSSALFSSFLLTASHLPLVLLWLLAGHFPLGASRQPTCLEPF